MEKRPSIPVLLIRAILSEVIFMILDKSDGLYRLTVGFNDGDVLYDNCVVYPRKSEIVMGQFALEPFDSLYGRFIAFDIKAKREIDTRAKETWGSIVGFIESLDASLVQNGSAYDVYIREVNRFKSLIEAVEEDQESVDYPAVLQSLFKHLEQYEDARREQTETV